MRNDSDKKSACADNAFAEQALMQDEKGAISVSSPKPAAQWLKSYSSLGVDVKRKHALCKQSSQCSEAALNGFYNLSNARQALDTSQPSNSKNDDVRWSQARNSDASMWTRSDQHSWMW
eukprot:4392605-Amphidinium_carterae.1